MPGPSSSPPGNRPLNLTQNPRWPFRAQQLHASPRFADPTSLPGLRGWWDFSTLGLADGTAISSLPDLSSNGNTMVQATGGRQPIYKTAIVNGRGVGRFDSADDGLTCSLTISSGPMTAVGVWKATTGSAVGRRAVQGTTNWLMGPYNDQHRFFNGAFAPTTPANDGSPHIHSFVIDTGTGVGYVDGVSQGDTGLGGLPGTIGIANFQGAAAAESFDGDFCELVVYDRALNSTERLAVEDYLYNKWFVAAASGPTNIDSSGGTATAVGASTSLTFTYTSASGTATAAGGTLSLAETLTAATGTATATGTLPVLSFTYTAVSGAATAGGGAVNKIEIAANGTATAGGSSSTLTFAYSKGSGTAAASGGTDSLAVTLTATSGTATTGGTVVFKPTYLAASGAATATGTLPVVTFVYGIAGGTATADGGSVSTGSGSNVSATGGLATASGSTPTLSVAYTVASGSATATGTGSTFTFAYTASTGSATATGGAVNRFTDVSGGLANATGQAATVTFIYTATTGLSSAIGGIVLVGIASGIPTRWEPGNGTRWPASSSTRWPGDTGTRWPPTTDDRWPASTGTRWN